MKKITPAHLDELNAAYYAIPPDLPRLQRAQAPIAAMGLCAVCALDMDPPPPLGPIEPGDKWNRTGRECTLCAAFFPTEPETAT